MKMKKPIRLPLRRTPRSRPASSQLRARAAAAGQAYDDDDYEIEEEPNMKFSHALMVVLALHLIAVGGVFAFNWMKARQTAEAKSRGPVVAETAPVAPAASAEPKPAAPESGPTYKVRPGDTLGRIAALHKTTIEAIEKENGLPASAIIHVGQVLRVPAVPVSSKAPEKPSVDEAGKKAFLATRTDEAKGKSDQPAPGVISAVPKAAPVARASATPAAAKPAVVSDGKHAAVPDAKPAGGLQGDVYVVEKGENPYTIAKKLNVTYQALLDANGISDPTKIQIGQKLKVPKS